MKVAAVAKLLSTFLLLSNAFLMTHRKTIKHHLPSIVSSKQKQQMNNLFGKLNRFKIDPELSMTAPEIIRNRNYPVELHNVTTRDGYILQLHRIPPNKNKLNNHDDDHGRSQSKVVYFQPGFLSTSGSGLVRGTGSNRTINGSLAFLLADRGYDVWLGNARGNTYSRKHAKLDPSKHDYWDFSWDEMGSEDIPGSINYILNLTGEKKLSFVCLSFGCTLFFIAMIVQPELNNSIEVAVALAPSGRLSNVQNAFATKFLAPYWDEIEFYYKRIRRVKDFADIGNLPDFRLMSRIFCRFRSIETAFCDKIAKQYRLLKGLILDRIPIISMHFPTGSSIKSMRHFERTYRAEDLLAFDYGPEGNLKRYGSVKPLRYDLSRVTAPVYIFWSDNDLYVPKKDIDWIAERLGNWKESIKVDAPYNHFDFLGSPDAHRVVNYRLLDLLPTS